MRYVEWYERHQGLLAKKAALAQAWEGAREAAAVLAAAEATAGGAAAASEAAAGPHEGKGSRGVAAAVPLVRPPPAETDPRRARTQRRLRAWRLRREAEAVRGAAEERARRALEAERERAAAARRDGDVKRRLERQRAARAAAEARRRAAEAAEAERVTRARCEKQEEMGMGPPPAVVLERRALAAVKAARAKWEKLRRRGQEAKPARRTERQRALLAGWRMEAAWRMEDDGDGVGGGGEEEGPLEPDPHCARRHGGFVEAAAGGLAEAAKPQQEKPQQKHAAGASIPARPKPFMGLQFRDARRLNQPTVAWKTRAFSEEDLAELDRRRFAGAHAQVRPPGFPPVVHG